MSNDDSQAASHDVAKEERIRVPRLVIGEDSPLRKLPRLERRQTLFLDGIRVSAEMIDLAYQRVRAVAYQLNCDNIDRLNGETRADPPPAAYAGMLLDAWSMIDAVHRLRSLLRQMPGLKRKSAPRLRKFLSETAAVSAMRNRVQHMDQEIRPLAEKQGPVWGVVSWIAHLPKRSESYFLCCVTPGTFSPFPYPAFKLGVVELDGPLGQFRLTAFGEEISLTRAYDLAEDVIRGLEESLRDAIPPDAPTAGVLPFACLELRAGSPIQQPPAAVPASESTVDSPPTALPSDQPPDRAHTPPSSVD